MRVAHEKRRFFNLFLELLSRPHDLQSHGNVSLHVRLLTRNKPFDSFMSRDFVEAGRDRLNA